MKLYNTLTRAVEPLTPLAPPTVTMYVCGPTVYDVPHLGHVRSAYIFDVLRRYLTFRGYAVTFVRNVTDVDDKIIDRARQEGGDLTAACQAVSQRYLQAYHEALERLGLEAPTREPLATAHVVPEMTDLISTLLIKGAAYEAQGDVYFSVRKFEAYGRLSNRSVDELKAGARAEPGEHPSPPLSRAGAGKQDPLDFALWKAAKPGEPAWNSPWGKGRPGWHIECSAMSMKHLGEAFDLHGGGLDLIFPHHENEIAQSQAAGKPFARHWVHHGLLTVNGEKMSKSLGNYVTVDDALNDVFQSPDALKVFFLGTHYRKPVDYSTETILAAYHRLGGWIAFMDWAENYRKMPRTSGVIPDEVRRLEAEFLAALDDDLNTPEALAVLDKLVTLGNESEKSLLFQQTQPWDKETVHFKTLAQHEAPLARLISAADMIKRLGSEAFGLGYQPIAVPADVQMLVDKREAARARKDFKMADALRKAIEETGFLVADTSGGPVIRPKR